MIDSDGEQMAAEYIEAETEHMKGRESTIEPAGAEGESAKTIAVRTEPSVPAIFNPLDAEPVAFKQALESRSANYDALAMHLRGILVAGKDFGRIHIAKKNKCDKPWACSYEAQPYHWSPYMLFSSGGDKILGLLGLAVSYPDEQDYRRAALKGMTIQDVIIKAFIDNGRGQSISEGMGAASRNDESGDLNRTIKKAEKRARMDAINRLPAVSALFEDDFLAVVAQQQNSTAKRQRQVSPQFSTGATLHVWPLKGKLEGQRFEEMEDGALDWILRTFEDKPDIYKSALRVREQRGKASLDNAAVSDPNAPRSAASHSDQSTEEWHRQYDDYPELQ